MTTSRILTILISFMVLSCNNKTDKISNGKKTNRKVVLQDSVKNKTDETFLISDTIKRFSVDDYPVTNKMIAKQKVDNYSSFKKKSGQIYSYDKAWFSNDSLGQTLVFEVYTDYHRLVTYLFYNEGIPGDLINRVGLHFDDGGLASQKQKLKGFNGFLKQATKINCSYFISDKGFKLGNSKHKAIDIYGQPDRQSINNGMEKLEWDFIGDIFYDGKTDLRGKPLAKDSFGNQVVMYFSNGKLIGQILHNDIP